MIVRTGDKHPWDHDVVDLGMSQGVFWC
jgi:hypothetical protein